MKEVLSQKGIEYSSSHSLRSAAKSSRLKRFFSEKGIEFIERDISKSDDAMKELQKLIVLATPMTVIDGKIIVGFDQQKLEHLLGN